MGAYIIRRILISIPVLFGITLIGFVALKLAPGDPLLSSVNPETLANLSRIRRSWPPSAIGWASISRSSRTST